MALRSIRAPRLQMPSWVPGAWTALNAKLEAERHQLPLFIPVFLGIGIALWFQLPTRGSWVSASAALAAFSVGVSLGGDRASRTLGIAASIAAVGLLLAWWHAEASRAPVLDRERFGVPLTAEVVEVERLDARGRTRLLLSPRSQLPADMRVRVSVRGAMEDIRPGATVRLRASLSPPPGPIVPGGYHFARRAWFEGIGATGFALGDVEVIENGPPALGFSARLSAFRAQLTERLQAGVGGREGGIAAALVTGDRGGIEPEVTEAMRDSGLAHLIAISGLHIAAVTGGIFWLVRHGLSLWPWFALRYDTRLAAAICAALAGVAYTLIAGAGVPTIRACLAVLIVLFGIAIGREAISLRLVAVGATVILVWRPDLLLSPSFQLSFAAVTGIVALYQSPWGRRWQERRQEGGLLRRLWSGLAALLVTGLVAEAAIGPIALAQFNQMGLYGAGANLIAIPLTSFVIIPLLLLAVLSMPLGLDGLAHLGLGKSIGLLIWLAEWTSALPGAVATIPTMPLAAISLIVLGGLWLCLWQTRWRLWGLAPVGVGILLAVLAPRPDVLVSPDGTHLAVLTEAGPAMLRPRAGSYVRDMWSAASGQADTVAIDDMDGSDCSADACVVRLERGGRTWTLLATRSDRLIPRETFEPACAASDIVVSARRLPDWCEPRWLRLGRTELAETGALAIELDRAAVISSAANDGEHPWAAQPRRR